MAAAAQLDADVSPASPQDFGAFLAGERDNGRGGAAVRHRRAVETGYCGARRSAKIAPKRHDPDDSPGRTRMIASAHAARSRRRARHRRRPHARRGAQSYPDKPIKMIVPFPPGGPIDTMARLTAPAHLDAARPAGRSSRTGRARAPPSATRPRRGRRPTATRCCSAPPARSGRARALCQAPASIRSSMFAPVASFVAAAACHGGAGRAVPAKTVAEFIAYAKANPGKLNYGAGLGTPPHLLSTLFKTQGRPRHHLRALQGRGAVGDRPARPARRTSPSTAR